MYFIHNLRVDYITIIKSFCDIQSNMNGSTNVFFCSISQNTPNLYLCLSKLQTKMNYVFYDK